MHCRRFAACDFFSFCQLLLSTCYCCMTTSCSCILPCCPQVMQTIGFLGPAFFLSQLSSVTSVTGAVLCMMGAQVGLVG
jgi:hypothetical protein